MAHFCPQLCQLDQTERSGGNVGPARVATFTNGKQWLEIEHVAALAAQSVLAGAPARAAPLLSSGRILLLSGTLRATGT